MPDANLIAVMAAWAGATAAVVFLAVARPWRERPRGVIRLAWGLAVAAGFGAGYLSYFGRPAWPVTQAHAWLVLVIAPAVVLIDAVALWGNRTRYLALGLSLILAFGYAPLILRNVLRHWSATEVTRFILAVGVVSFLVIALLGGLARREVGRTLAFGLAIWAVATGIVSAESGLITGAAQGFALAAALAAGWVVSWSVAPGKAAAGVSGIGAVLLLAILAQGMYLANITTLNGVLLAVAPLAMWVGEAPILARRPKWLRTVIRLTALAAILAIPVALATLQFLRDTAQGADGYS